ncbi:FkbM family methyltransferase [Rhodospirillum sp. A1_3_36]|uniref:FkbM family methyltransferase n=1 Tax=Rhodospirillum sp. A1_3_36 TaxID=3391666 RepID=UPI0039A6B110
MTDQGADDQDDGSRFSALVGEQVNFWEIIDLSDKHHIDRVVALAVSAYQGKLVDARPGMLLDFLTHAVPLVRKSSSQLMQDIFASFAVGDRAPLTFLEFGASDGVYMSNSLMLDRDMGWTGVLSEPSIYWHEALRGNRPKARILTECVWRATGEQLEFFESECAPLSTLANYRYSDAGYLPGNSKERNTSGRSIQVESLSLNDLVDREFGGEAPSYISLDTEGSEYEILKAFDFGRFRPIVLTVEHNFTDEQRLIDGLMEGAGYLRVFRNLTAFDAWYMRADLNVWAEEK